MKINAEQYDKILAHLRLISASDIDAKKRDTTLTELLNALGVAVGRVEGRADVAARNSHGNGLQLLDVQKAFTALQGRLDAMESVLVEVLKALKNSHDEDVIEHGEIRGMIADVFQLGKLTQLLLKADAAQPRKRKGKK